MPVAGVMGGGAAFAGGGRFWRVPGTLAALVTMIGLTSGPRLAPSASPRGTSAAPASERPEASDRGGAALCAPGNPPGGAGGPWHVRRRLLSSAGKRGTLTLVVIWVTRVSRGGVRLCDDWDLLRL